MMSYVRYCRWYYRGNYDIIVKTMISYAIPCVWYHAYDRNYDIIGKNMISYHSMWAIVRYHMIWKINIIYNIITDVIHISTISYWVLGHPIPYDRTNHHFCLKPSLKWFQLPVWFFSVIELLKYRWSYLKSWNIDLYGYFDTKASIHVR